LCAINARACAGADQRFALLLSRRRRFGILQEQFRQHDGADVLRAPAGRQHLQNRFRRRTFH